MPKFKTCMLVKPGDRDPYAEMLARLPALVPEPAGEFDAMAGRPSPTTLHELIANSEPKMVHMVLAQALLPFYSPFSEPEELYRDSMPLIPPKPIQDLVPALHPVVMAPTGTMLPRKHSQRGGVMVALTVFPAQSPRESKLGQRKTKKPAPTKAKPRKAPVRKRRRDQ